MTEESQSAGIAAMKLVAPRADYRDAAAALVAAEWTPGGVGDWAFVLRSPDGALAARISPFDPAGPYSAALYVEAAHTRQVPSLFTHRRLTGGGDLQLLEWLEPVSEDEGVTFQRAIAQGRPEVAEVARAIHRVHEQARRELPWCGPVDTNPTNIMRADDGRVVVSDPFYADGSNLYATVWSNPDLVVAQIPEAERRFMTEIPTAHSGPWESGTRQEMRELLRAADARREA